MSLYINFDDTFHIHKFYIIHQEETRMDKNNGMITHKHDSTEIINRIQNELKKNIINREEKNGEHDEIAEIWWKDSSVLCKNPDEKPEWNQEKYEFRWHEKKKDSMSTNWLVMIIHIEKEKCFIFSYFWGYGFMNNPITSRDTT